MERSKRLRAAFRLSSRRPDDTVLVKISQDQIARRIVLLLRCPIFAEGMTSTEIGTNLEKEKETYRSVVLPRLSEFQSSGLVVEEPTRPIGPPKYKLTPNGRSLADWLYEEILHRKDNLQRWEVEWDEALDSREKPKIDAVKSRIQGELLDFVYYV